MVFVVDPHPKLDGTIVISKRRCFPQGTGDCFQFSRAGVQRKPSHLCGSVVILSHVGDFGRNDWEWLGIWLLGLSAAQTSSQLGGLVVIEHNLDVIRCADWFVDLGPEGGGKGGEIVVVGTPETVAEHRTSHAGRYLKQMLEQHPPGAVAG